MKEIIESPCPLCKSKSEYYFVDFGNIKYYKCDTCSLYQISLHAERLISSAPQDYLLSLSIKSKGCTQDTALNITTKADHSVSVEVRDRASLPRQ